MKKEEKLNIVVDIKKVRLQIIMLVFIFVSTVMIQIADYRIDEHNNLISRLTLDVSNRLQVYTAQKMQAYYTISMQIFPFHQLSEKDKEKNKKYLIKVFELQRDQNEDMKAIVSELKSGSIGLREYYIKCSEINERLSLAYLNQYSYYVEALNKTLGKTPIWQILKTYIFFPTQIFLILTLIAGYWLIMRDISKQAKK